MKQRQGLLCVAGVAVMFGALSSAQVPAPATDTPVLAQDLKQLRVPGKVTAALWTVRTDRCTLQVIMFHPGSGARAVPASRKQDGRYTRPNIDLWLLGAGGTVITAYYRWDSANLDAKQLTSRDQAPEMNFQFPRGAATQAVAAVLKVDGTYFIEPIHPFEK